MLKNYIKKVVRGIGFDVNEYEFTKTVLRGEIVSLKDSIRRDRERMTEIEEKLYIRVNSRGMAPFGRDYEFVSLEFAIRKLFEAMGYEIGYQPDTLKVTKIEKSDGK